MQISDYVQSLSQQCITPAGLGTMSPSVYDTAWIAMVKQELNGTIEFQFPEALDYILETQLPDGSWPAYSSEVDGILNTLSALLSLKVHLRSGSKVHNLKERCFEAERALNVMFKKWDIDSTDRVGLEILVPSLLRELQDEEVSFVFPGLEELRKRGESKMKILSRIPVEKHQSTLLHSLDALVGNLNFDTIKHHKLPNGSMMNSPSSTAAYLMNCSIWDDDAASYLRSVVEHSKRNGWRGGVPSAFPTPVFELSWAVTTLLRTPAAIQNCEGADVARIADYLDTTMQKQGWRVGFAPHCLADADDTSKSLLALRLMGREIDFEPMLAEFERSTYFITYYGERNASISANCNVLAALLQSGNVAKYTSQILKCAEFLNNAWRSGNVQDKWNISKNYSMMLLTQAFVHLLRAWNLKQLDSDADLEALMQSVRATLLDVYVQTVQHQHEDGSWSSMREVTAYAILTLSSLVELPWKDSIRTTAAASIAKGKSYLLKHQNLWAEAEYLWIEKVAYSSSNLSNAYCLAAVEASGPRARLVNDDEMAFAKSSAHIAKYTGLFTALKTFQNCPEWKLEASVMQSQPFVADLRSRQARIFPEMGKMKSHKYMDMIPLTWIGCNHVRDHGVSSTMLWEMMMISMLNYQADVYMEMVVGEKLDGSLAEVRSIIDRAIKPPTRVCGKRKGEHKDDQQNGSVSNEANGTNPHGHKRAKMNGSNGTHINGGPVTGACQFENGSIHTNGTKECTSDNGISKGTMPSKSVLAEVEVTINAFTTYVLTHPSVLRSPSYLQRWLAQSLHAFLDAHITQIEDCKLLSDGELPKETYYNWVHTTSSNHTSCPYSFVFYLCLLHGARTGIGKTPVDLFPGAKTKYMLEDACRHLATICRQHNDFGSVERDKQEANLNSVDFPEFGGTQESEMGADRSDSAVAQAKKEVLVIGEYERKFLDLSLAELRKNVKQDVMRELMLLFHVTDLYGEIYLARDMSPSRSSLQ